MADDETQVDHVVDPHEVAQHQTAYLDVLRMLDPEDLSDHERSMLDKERRIQSRARQRQLAHRRQQRLEYLEQIAHRRVRSVDTDHFPVFDDNRSHPVRVLDASRRLTRHMSTVALRRVRDQISRSEASMDVLRTELKLNQASVRQDDAEIARLEAAIAADNGCMDPDLVEQVIKEFRRLERLPGITGINSTLDGEIVVSYQLRIPAGRGKVYDGGDWELTVGRADRYYPGIYLARNSKVLDHPPAYDGRDSFCFGSRSEQLSSLMHRGEYLEAIEVALGCLRDINRAHGRVASFDDLFPKVDAKSVAA